MLRSKLGKLRFPFFLFFAQLPQIALKLFVTAVRLRELIQRSFGTVLHVRVDESLELKSAVDVPLTQRQLVEPRWDIRRKSACPSIDCCTSSQLKTGFHL